VGIVLSWLFYFLEKKLRDFEHHRSVTHLEIGDIVIYKDKKYVVVNIDNEKVLGIKQVEDGNFIFVPIDDLQPPIFPSEKK
jgi:hypothetical protein